MLEFVMKLIHNKNNKMPEIIRVYTKEPTFYFTYVCLINQRDITKIFKNKYNKYLYMAITVFFINKYNINKFVNVNILSKIIYNNFIDLTNANYISHNKNEIFELLTNDQLNGYLLFDDNNLIGYLIGTTKILPDSRYVYFLNYIFIANKYKNKKLGSLLINNLIQYCEFLGIKIITLICDFNNSKVMNFYKKFGFVKDTSLNNNKQHNVLSLYINE